ncbi:MAG: protein jag [Oscillospiraceae bacterium]|nr:protein jag [Oscillospiraceae bacterium]
MTKSIEVTAKTEEEAIASALKELGVAREDVSVEVLERSKSGFLGLGAAPAKVRVTYEVADDNRSRVERYLRGLLDCMGVTAEITFTERGEDALGVELSGEGMGAVIGRRGETLDAIQHLVNYSVNRGGEKRVHVTIDAEGYRRKREESLVRLAEKMAAKALKYHRSMALEPMNSYERHVIHTALQDYEGVSTASVGTEPNRRVVINCDREHTDYRSKPTSREWS